MCCSWLYDWFFPAVSGGDAGAVVEFDWLWFSYGFLFFSFFFFSLKIILVSLGFPPLLWEVRKCRPSFSALWALTTKPGLVLSLNGWEQQEYGVHWSCSAWFFIPVPSPFLTLVANKVQDGWDGSVPQETQKRKEGSVSMVPHIRTEAWLECTSIVLCVVMLLSMIGIS